MVKLKKITAPIKKLGSQNEPCTPMRHISASSIEIRNVKKLQLKNF